MSRVNSAYTQLMHMRRVYLSKSVAFLSLDIPFTLHTHPLMGNQHSNMTHKDRQTHHYGRQEEEYHLEIPDMVDDRFKVEGRLGAGSFGVLHEGKLLNHVTRSMGLIGKPRCQCGDQPTYCHKARTRQLPCTTITRRIQDLSVARWSRYSIPTTVHPVLMTHVYIP